MMESSISVFPLINLAELDTKRKKNAGKEIMKFGSGKLK